MTCESHYCYLHGQFERIAPLTEKRKDVADNLSSAFPSISLVECIPRKKFGDKNSSLNVDGQISFE